MRRFFAILGMVLFVLPALAQAPNSALPGPDDRARQWLALVDDFNFAESAAQTGPQARKADIAAVPGLRAPLGAMSSRTLKDVKLAKTLPGLPSGQYAVVRYDSNFAHKAPVVETVTLALNKAGWAVIGYRID